MAKHSKGLEFGKRNNPMHKRKDNPEYETFNSAMDAILKANPKVVKAAMEEEKAEREKQRKAKRASAARASTVKG